MKKIFKIVITSFILLLMLSINNKVVKAEEVYKNEETGYVIYIDDYAELLSAGEREKLKDDMIKLTKYCNAAFVTTNDNTHPTQYYAEDYYYEHFGYNAGTVFVIDMNHRYMYIKNNGGVDKIITNAKSDIITDNNYTYATNKEYYECAKRVFDQIYTLLDGGKISEPMRHISNAILAIYTSFILCYLVVMNKVKTKKQDEFKHYEKTMTVGAGTATYTGDKKVYTPPSSSGGSSGGGGGGGGGGGSGGGHSF